LVATHGVPVEDAGGLTHLFPDSAAVADADPESLAMPRSRRASLLGLARALTEGQVDLGAGTDWHRARAQLAALPGLGPWTVETIAMRALGDPDAFPVTDLGIRAAVRTLDLPEGPPALLARAAAWRPWRAYATQYLWATGDHAINQMPTPDGGQSVVPSRTAVR
jgi:AraC family transcriptional regulator of adaptative response / DNA-3-methyladenine glycosylase II